MRPGPKQHMHHIGQIGWHAMAGAVQNFIAYKMDKSWRAEGRERTKNKNTNMALKLSSVDDIFMPSVCLRFRGCDCFRGCDLALVLSSLRPPWLMKAASISSAICWNIFIKILLRSTAPESRAIIRASTFIVASFISALKEAAIVVRLYCVLRGPVRCAAASELTISSPLSVT